MNKQQLSEALEAWDQRDWSRQVEAVVTVQAAARLVERLLPGECEHGETTEHGAFRPGVPGSSWMCPGQVWDEGIVEAVAEYLGEFAHFSEDRARGVLAVLVELLTEKVET